ncbi:phosphatidate cytidylyltransferase [Psychroserpens sp.]|uniref:phosphatidate cytidylyltransferase n=1 Tax=Psychroserpens sp. TaxID=2020870 RepID=UPI001AFEE86D|nr:phosphatidate cytidylyltransferase [Psychroserpens sp.]MBO6606257.1 phosphatidate cytidylyltransferase [Psychroserpens sp.]MBO6652371.1 phosphatidate cytidylyltransferase [Psychroserpens sp.]MBO6681857.1 phosphatidate cytidylyltransferase [Psychroserpens sp.]MBO6749632.1 phosphatidate cytidylyltransferase [Psychroserpens sp.]MBO6913923.1 phosphatidate cytidylyltransferase [Psychroserpens sp.]
MKEIVTRALSGLLYVSLLIASLYWQNALIALFFVFGLICMAEFKKLIQLKSFFPYIVFSILYLGFAYWKIMMDSAKGVDEASQILLVITIFVELLLIKDLFSEKTIPLFSSKRFIITTFYLSSGFVFLICIANFNQTFTPLLLLGSFILVWINDTFAYLIGKNFGKQKLFPSISPKKTVEGFLGGLFFACIGSYFIAHFTETLTFNYWLILSIIVSVFGTLGDLIESKFKRMAQVKDSGVIMPGHGGLLDRLDSIIFAAPFIFLFLRLITYVS